MYLLEKSFETAYPLSGKKNSCLLLLASIIRVTVFLRVAPSPWPPLASYISIHPVTSLKLVPSSFYLLAAAGPEPQ